jgi:hypothetical protein
VLFAIAIVCITTQLEALSLVLQRIRTLYYLLHAQHKLRRQTFFFFSVAMEWKQTTRSTTVEEGETPEDGIYMQREVHKPIPATLRNDLSCDSGQDQGRCIAHP